MRIFEERKHSIAVSKDTEYEPPTIFERMDNEPASIHRARMVSKFMSTLDTKTVILHRKRFYDDQREKLVLMFVQIKLN